MQWSSSTLALAIGVHPKLQNHTSAHLDTARFGGTVERVAIPVLLVEVGTSFYEKSERFRLCGTCCDDERRCTDDCGALIERRRVFV